MRKRRVKRLYQQVANRLMALIDSRAYPTGSRLPAERKLAEQFAVSRSTIREAIIALEIAGYVEVKTGSGVYVSNTTGIRRLPAESELLKMHGIAPCRIGNDSVFLKVSTMRR